MAALSILQVNHADVRGGGAALAGYRLHRALIAAGARSSMLVGTKSSDDPDVAELRALRRLRRPLRAVAQRAGLNDLDGIAAYGLARRGDFTGADVVHYHAIHGSWFSYPEMVRATAAKPSVLTLHDMWPFTGHCSFSFECERWRRGCGSCPHPEVFPAIRRDATALEWRLKQRVWAGSHLSVVAPSAWLAEQARNSMLGRFEISVIPYGIDTSEYAPVEPGAARQALGLPAGDPVVLFAASSVADYRKGADLVPAAVARLPLSLRRRLTVMLMGSSADATRAALVETGCTVADFGYVHHDRLKSVLYSAADLFVFPTRADNSPLVILESLACATPVVSFDVGGVAEVVRPGHTGLLAPLGDTEALAAHLLDLLEDTAKRATMGAAARKLMVEQYPAHLAAERHLSLYERLAEQGPGA